MESFWDYHFYNNTVKDWTIAIGIIVVTITILALAKKFVLQRVKALAARTTNTLDDFIIGTVEKSVMPLLYVLSFYFGLQYLTFPAKVVKVLHIAIMLVMTFFLLRIITSFIAFLFKQALVKQEYSEQREKQSKGILLLIQGVVWLLGFIFLIDNLGYDITTLIAGLGIGGIAIALAAQTILGDLFSYFVIFFDKPFEIGDFITVEDKAGTVEYVGIKTTRIRSLSGEQLVCSNTYLTNARVHNFKRLMERRILFAFGVTYGTPAAKLKQIPDVVKSVIEQEEDARFDRAHFKNFGDFSLNFEVVYYVLKPEYNVYMDLQQSINLKIYTKLEEMGVEFAFPTQTIFLHAENKPVPPNVQP